MGRSERLIDTVRAVDAILEAAGIGRQEHRQRFVWESGDLQVTGTENPAELRKTERKEARRPEERKPERGRHGS
ncbi:MAG: hypothetical protein QMD46_08925 [Methanomicrobiales archaeon]|nr:hypothetical protein [Methanomicrobiales archaeon]MDI6875490.1 hypothetical protein [Methanomicrobiales archaeon]